MDPAAYTQIATIVAGVLAIIWHQQRNTDKLRAEMRGDRSDHRAEFSQVRAEIGEVRTEVAQVSQRVARIEGALGVGVPAESAPPTEAAPAQPEAAGSVG